jgi:hypothetical protein
MFLVVNNIHMHKQRILVINISHFITTHRKKQWFICHNFDGAQHNLVHSLGHGPTSQIIPVMFSKVILHLQKLKKLFELFKVCH